MSDSTVLTTTRFVELANEYLARHQHPLAVSVPEAAKALGISRTYAYELAKKGDLPSVRLGRRLLVPVAELDKLLAGPPGKAAS